ncbi:hypothetical protein AYI98_00820 [Shewanella algae]|nr:hypothetical protein AYI98_00820 [Shewanella algae]
MMLGLSQAELAALLGWTGPKQIQNLELGHRPITKQTALAIECLLRRAGRWLEFSDNLKIPYQP